MHGGQRLQQLADRIQTLAPGSGHRVFVDSGPVLERAVAHEAGLGWFGKNTMLIHRDASALVLNKLPGLATQGGTKTHDHLDGLLDALCYEREDRPKLVHRLDKGTSGLLVVAKDEHPRDTSLEALAKLKGVVRPDGTVTAGNASGVNDGSCAILVASEAALKTHNLTPRARVVGMATAGVPPRIMGIGPAPATKKVLAQTGLSIGQMDVIELNEAFAAQGLAVLRELGVADDDARVNPNGGAIALGHPLGASGARLATTAVNQLHRTGGRYALCTMCIGVGQGIAVILERV